MTTEHRRIVWLPILILTVPGLASADRQGRLIGKVVDPKGSPIPGVRVTTTCAKIPDFRDVTTTNDKGIFKVDFERIDVVYHYEFEKTGYLMLKVEQRWTLEGTEHHEFKMDPAETLTAVGGRPPASTSNEAKTGKAREDLERSGRLSEEAKRIHNEAVALSKGGDDAGAFAKFKEALAIDPGFQPALLGLATTGLKIDRAAEAAAAAATILKADPRNEQAIRIRYNASLKLGDTAMIVDSLVGLAAVDRVMARDGLFKLATVAYDADDTVNAKVRFGKVLELDPNHPRSHYFLGLILMREGAKEGAKSHLQRFLELAPDDPDAATARDALGYLRTN